MGQPVVSQDLTAYWREHYRIANRLLPSIEAWLRSCSSADMRSENFLRMKRIEAVLRKKESDVPNGL